VTDGPIELLALLGRAAPRLLLWPGGLGLLVLALTLLRAWRRGELLRLELAGLAACAAPLLALALLPLPGVAALDRDVDLFTALSLLELPRWLRAGRGWQQGESRSSAALLAIELNGLPMLALAAVLIAQAAGSLNLGALASPSMLGLLAASAWALALSGLLYTSGARLDAFWQAAEATRFSGHILLASLLLAGTLPLPTLLGRWAGALALLVLLLVLGHSLRRRIGLRFDALLCLFLGLALLLSAAATFFAGTGLYVSFADNN
jgi:hypothetical protein